MRLREMLVISLLPALSGLFPEASAEDLKFFGSEADICSPLPAKYGLDMDEAAVVIGDFFDGRFPLFVKPANSGSSVGITKVRTLRELPEALRVAVAEDAKAVIEETIVGRELEVAVLGNEDPQASCIGEVISANEFYDYVAKYDNIGSETSIVTDLPESLEESIRQTAVEIYQIMGCAAFPQEYVHAPLYLFQCFRRRHTFMLRGNAGSSISV